jgi:hypothetical protein
MKIRRIVFLIFFSLIFFFSCKTNISSEEKLKTANNDLNKAFSKKDWDKVYNYLEKSREEGILKSKVTRKSFVADCNKAFVGGILDVKTFDLKLKGKLGVAKNLINFRSIIPPFQTGEDTLFHFWIYSNNEWYIEDWDVRLNLIKSELPDSIYNSILDKTK